VLLRDRAGEHERDARRIAAACEALGATAPILRAAGDGPALVRLARLLSFVDFTSVYLGLALGVDPTPIDTIGRIKAALATGTATARESQAPGHEAAPSGSPTVPR
jgi:glucose/mannose-6-phosphate isomerase